MVATARNNTYHTDDNLTYIKPLSHQLIHQQGHPFFPVHKLCTPTVLHPPKHPCPPKYLLSAKGKDILIIVRSVFIINRVTERSHLHISQGTIAGNLVCQPEAIFIPQNWRLVC